MLDSCRHGARGRRQACTTVVARVGRGAAQGKRSAMPDDNSEEVAVMDYLAQE